MTEQRLTDENADTVTAHIALPRLPRTRLILAMSAVAAATLTQRLAEEGYDVEFTEEGAEIDVGKPDDFLRHMTGEEVIALRCREPKPKPTYPFAAKEPINWTHPKSPRESHRSRRR